jgi:hypothetical protein
MTDLTNLTPHDVVVVADDGSEQTITYPRSGTVARAIEHHTMGHALADNMSIGTKLVRYDGVENLPEPKLGHGYIVSVLTAMAAQSMGRSVEDLYYPGELIRDISGRVIGCSALYQLAPSPLAAGSSLVQGEEQ